MKISILTLFPEMFQGPFNHSIIKHAQEKKLVDITFVNIRDFGIGTHHVVDDTPYGGGIGMVMRVDVVHNAIKHTKETFQQSNNEAMEQSVVLLTASGTPFKQQIAKDLSQLDHLILICGHYEGVDDRIRHFIDAEISIGDFVLTGGEIPAMLITDSVIRLLPEVLKTGVTDAESFSLKNATNPEETFIEYPQYTRPDTYENHVVPEILLTGNHKNIEAWRQEQAKIRTHAVRPDLIPTIKTEQ